MLSDALWSVKFPSRLFGDLFMRPAEQLEFELAASNPQPRNLNQSEAFCSLRSGRFIFFPREPIRILPCQYSLFVVDVCLF